MNSLWTFICLGLGLLKLLFSLTQKRTRFLVLFSCLLIFWYNLLHWLINLLSLSWQLSFFSFFKVQWLSCFLNFFKELSFHDKKIILFWCFQVQLFSFQRKVLLKRFLFVFCLLKSINKFLMLKLKKRYIFRDEDTVLIFNFFKFLFGNLNAFLGDFFLFKLLLERFNFLVFERDVSVDIFFWWVKHISSIYLLWCVYINNSSF